MDVFFGLWRKQMKDEQWVLTHQLLSFVIKKKKSEKSKFWVLWDTHLIISDDSLLKLLLLL